MPFRKRVVAGPIAVALVYAAFGVLWILFSDQLTHILVADPETELRVQTAKGWLFVLITAGLVYLLVRGYGATISKAALQAEDSAALSRLVFQSIPHMAAVVKVPELRLTTVNDEFTAMLGHVRADALGRTLDELELWEGEAERGAVLDLVARNSDGEAEVRLRGRDGRTLFALVSVRPLTLQEQPHAVVVARDITAAKLADEARRTAMEEMEAVITERTRALRQEIAERQSAERALQQANEQLEERVRARTRELEQEIAERRRIEAEVFAAKELAEQANRAKTVFLANMSHELRTPLNSIIGFTDLLNRQVLGPLGSPKYLEYVRDVNDAGRHLLELINDLLDISRVEIQAFQLNESDVDVGRLLRACARMTSDKTRNACLDLEIDVPGTLPALRGDERRLRQIVLNLLSNARKFTPSGGRIRMSAAIDADDRLSFAVADTGIGIAAKDLEVVMSMFGQVDDHLTRRHQGAGLGLPLSRRLAELHGAILSLQSEPGKGTMVKVTFPSSRTVRRE